MFSRDGTIFKGFAMKEDVDLVLEDSRKDFSQAVYDIFGDAMWNMDVWHPTVADIETCFKILNKYVFDRKLVMPEIRVERFNPSVHVNENGDFFIGRFHLSVTNVKTDSPEFSMYILIVDCGKSDFFNVMNTLCHEMIHLYDYLYRNTNAILNDTIMKHYDKSYKPKYDTHGKVFMDELARINSNFGLDVTKEESFSVTSRFKQDMPMNKTDSDIVSQTDLLQESDETLLSAGYDAKVIDTARRLKSVLCVDKYTEVKLEKDGSISIDVY